jgi:hypothetical protein
MKPDEITHQEEKRLSDIYRILNRCEFRAALARAPHRHVRNRSVTLMLLFL